MLNASSSPAEPPDFADDRTQLLKSLELFDQANELTQPPEGQSSFKATPEASRRVEELIADGLVAGKSISDEYLDWLHPQMKTYYREKYLAGQALYLKGLRKDASRTSCVATN